MKATFAATFLDQSTSGPAQIRPRSAGLISTVRRSRRDTPAGVSFDPAPLTPRDIAALPEALMTLTERTKTFHFSLDTGLEYVSRQHHRRRRTGARA